MFSVLVSPVAAVSDPQAFSADVGDESIEMKQPQGVSTDENPKNDVNHFFCVQPNLLHSYLLNKHASGPTSVFGASTTVGGSAYASSETSTGVVLHPQTMFSVISIIAIALWIV